VNRPESLTAPAAFPDVSTVVSHRNGAEVRTAMQWRASSNGHVLFSDSISEPCDGALTSCWLSTPSALPLPGAAGTNVLVAFQPSEFSDRPLILRMHRRDGPALWQRKLAASGLIGAADVLGTGRADLVVVVGHIASTLQNPVGSPGRLAFLDENSGETILERPLPNDIQTVNLAPSLTAGGRTASVVFITDDYRPPRRNDFVTALTGPTLRPLWTSDLGDFPANLTCCGFGTSIQHPSGTGVAYVPVDDPAGDLTGDGVPELLMTHGHDGPLILDGATGRQLLYLGGGPTEDFFVVRAARPGRSGLIAFTGEQYPSDLGFGLWMYDGAGQLVWHTDKLGGSFDIGDVTGDGTDDIATVEFTQFGPHSSRVITSSSTAPPAGHWPSPPYPASRSKTSSSSNSARSPSKGTPLCSPRTAPSAPPSKRTTCAPAHECGRRPTWNHCRAEHTRLRAAAAHLLQRREPPAATTGFDRDRQRQRLDPLDTRT
jgi:hypothetical protein